MNNTANKKNDGNNIPSIGNLYKVDPSHDFNKSTDGKWGSVLKALNPFSAIAESYSRTLAYKIEIKRLDAEISRIKEQAKIAHEVIDKKFKLKMEELKQRRIVLIKFYQTVNDELKRFHIERIEVLKMAKRAQEKSFDTSLPLEERRMFKEMSIEMIRQLPKFGDKSNESLQKLINALPPVEISSRLLEG